VETTRRGIAPWVAGRRILRVVVREPRLRWPVPEALPDRLAGARVLDVRRRGKYLILETEAGAVILHLGMSGSLRIADPTSPPGPHDHVDFELDSGTILRLRDPRRFGAVLWGGREPERHPLLRDLGPEPFDARFDGQWLYIRSRGRRVAVKPYLMDARVVTGVGNIYANEALWLAGIDPRRQAGRIGRKRYDRLAEAVRQVLNEAIEAGGTTLRDFVCEDGRPGYFSQALRVYGREGAPCPRCRTPIRRTVLGQRSTYWCPRCQH
jgi:formamidopyrimidine-DNA glycosylase